MKQYTVTTTENLRALCIKNGWFKCGSNKQYEKLFRANGLDFSIEEIATIIWLCSDEEYCDILLKLREERIDYWKRMFGIENANQTYKVVDIFGKNFKLTFKQIVMLYAATDSGNDLKSFDEGIWLIGNIADNNAKRIGELTLRLSKTVSEKRKDNCDE